MSSVLQYFRDVQAELAKVVWPSRQQVIQHSLLVIGISLVMAAYFGLLDYLFTRGLQFVVALVQ